MFKQPVIRRGLALLLTLALLALSLPAQASDRIYYTSQPDEILIFFNNVALVKDRITMPAGTQAAVTLPSQIYPNTLVLREDGERVSSYRLRSDGGQMVLIWESAARDGLREVTLDYLISGVGWQPKYDMWMTRENSGTVALDFFAEISNPALTLEGVVTTLVAGRVDTTNQVELQSRITANQYIAGYQGGGAAQLAAGAVDIQTLYAVGAVDAQPGETVYVRLEQASLPARRVLLWNAQTGSQVNVIYKVRNESQLPLAEGIVRAYEDGIFLGSDFVELTPIGGEGSITVGALQGVRVNRSQTQNVISGLVGYRRTQVELTVNNFNAEAVEMEIVDAYPTSAVSFEFSREPEWQIGNLLRWGVTLQPGEELKITYQYDQRV